jgi:hypothetical protein
MSILPVKLKKRPYSVVEFREVQTRRGTKHIEVPVEASPSRSASPSKKRYVPPEDDGFDFGDDRQDGHREQSRVVAVRRYKGVRDNNTIHNSTNGSISSPTMITSGSGRHIGVNIFGSYLLWKPVRMHSVTQTLANPRRCIVARTVARSTHVVPNACWAVIVGCRFIGFRDGMATSGPQPIWTILASSCVWATGDCPVPPSLTQPIVTSGCVMPAMILSLKRIHRCSFMLQHKRRRSHLYHSHV